MMWFLAAKAFLARVPFRVYALGGIIVAVLLLVWIVQRRIQAELDYIHGLEMTNAQLTKTNQDLNGKVRDLAQTNRDNAETYKQSLAQAEQARQIADAERDAATRRTSRYRSIRDAAQSTRSTVPVDPVVSSTIDRLWESPKTTPQH